LRPQRLSVPAKICEKYYGKHYVGIVRATKGSWLFLTMDLKLTLGLRSYFLVLPNSETGEKLLANNDPVLYNDHITDCNMEMALCKTAGGCISSVLGKAQPYD
jgi:hypothetical protein